MNIVKPKPQVPHFDRCENDDVHHRNFRWCTREEILM